MAAAQFPQELVAAIFEWLPVKSLLRFKCLSKSFCALIRSVDFINTHSTRSCQTLKFRKLIFQDKSNNKFRVCDFNLDLNEEIHPLGNPVSSKLKQISGHCRGLILLNYRRFKLALWNPSTRRFRVLSDCPPLLCTDRINFPSFPRINCIIGSGLGYSESRAEFKVFCVVHIKPKNKVQVWVYELKSMSWRRIQDFPCPSAIQFPPGIGRYADGGVHWLCKLSGDPNRPAIVSVDVSKEDFSVEPLPDSLALKPTNLHVLDGSLCISHVSRSPVPQASLYIRKSDGNGQFYWIQNGSAAEPLGFRMFLFGLQSVLGCLKKGDKVLLDLGQAGLHLYDLKAKCLEKVEIRKNANWKRPILCPESLVSVDGSA